MMVLDFFMKVFTIYAKMEIPNQVMDDETLLQFISLSI